MMFIVTIMLSACNDTGVNNTIYVFSQPGCGHCINAHDYMNRYYKDYNIKEINIREGANINQLMRFASKFNVPQNYTFSSITTNLKLILEQFRCLHFDYEKKTASHLYHVGLNARSNQIFRLLPLCIKSCLQLNANA